MTDVVFLSSVFNEVKIAEPMGASILTACLRKQGFSVEIVEPSVEGWGVERTVEEVAARDGRIVAISMLRDKNVKDVLRFVALLRSRCPERFIVVGGHGPSIALANVDPRRIPRGWMNIAPDLGEDIYAGDHWKPSMAPVEISRGPIVDPSLVDRGKGPGTILPSTEANQELFVAASSEDSYYDVDANTSSSGDYDPDESSYFASADADSPYFDKSREYLQILLYADTYMLGESDTNFPVLVDRVLKGEPWKDVEGLAYVDESGHLVRNQRPDKIADLDSVPHMARDVLLRYKEKYGERLPASILASRGCYYRCTFCSVVQYELLQNGKNHRQRSNEDIIAEMRYLHEEYGVTHFNFEDDNFIVKNKIGIRKLHDFCDQLMAADFAPSFAFFCRADAVAQNEDLFRHMRDAGLTGIYFGMESVHPGDLEFFHKGTRVEDNYKALDVLMSLGFSPGVDADLRIMLGYITWHPLTSFTSLRATSEFVQTYQAPPKLLRRKLRLYSATEIVAQVRTLGLINPSHKDGWNFKDPRVEGLDRWVDNYSGTVNKVRDKLRTLEKAAHQYGYPVDVDALATNRMAMDDMLYMYFDEAVATADSYTAGASAPEMEEFDHAKRAEFDHLMEERGVEELIVRGYETCGFDTKAKDLFRK